MQKFKVNSQLLSKIEWKQMEGRMEAIALPPMLMWSVKTIGMKHILHDKTLQQASKQCFCGDAGKASL